MSNILIMENAKIIFRNFQGLESKFNREGNKNFCLLIEDGALADRLLQDGWNIQENEEYGITGYIGEWWWYACNYIWANFPPLYWGLADILTDAKVDYIPLFY